MLYRSHCFFPTLYDISPRNKQQHGASTWSPKAGLKRKEAVVRASLQRSGALPRYRLCLVTDSGLHLKDEVEGYGDRCTLCTEENTTDATLERARERNKLYLIFIRKED